MSKAIVNVSDIIFNIKDKNTKYFFYIITNKDRAIFSAPSINNLIKASSNTTSSQSVSTTESPLFGRGI